YRCPVAVSLRRRELHLSRPPPPPGSRKRLTRALRRIPASVGASAAAVADLLAAHFAVSAVTTVVQFNSGAGTRARTTALHSHRTRAATGRALRHGYVPLSSRSWTV